MSSDKTPDKDEERLESGKILRALGLFLLTFGLLVLVAVGFTETPEGRYTNLGAGAALTLIGAVMILKSRKAPAARPD